MQGPAGVVAEVALEAHQLAKFRQGEEWDAQRIGGTFHPEYVDYSTVAIGLYTAAAGIPEHLILLVQDRYAKVNSKFHTNDCSDDYPHLPKRNVDNTHIGYKLYQEGYFAR